MSDLSWVEYRIKKIISHHWKGEKEKEREEERGEKVNEMGKKSRVPLST